MKDVHTRHCCAIHGCKYGDRACSVLMGYGKQEFLCETCREERVTSINGVREYKNFQARVQDWVLAAFGEVDPVERTHRFLEESLELVQACGMTREEVYLLVEYVFARPKGGKKQEVGGVMVTLAGLCAAQGIDMKEAGEFGLREGWEKIDKIRAKRANKPEIGPLPGKI